MPEHLTTLCLGCGQSFTYRKTKRERRYCSLACTGTGKVRPLAERLRGHTKQVGECWLWTGQVNASGYGRIEIADKRCQAHRVSWEVHRGPIPDGLSVLHNCPDGDNPRCINPKHLFLGTHLDNMRDMAQKGRAAKTALSHPESRPRGSRAPSALLTEEAVRAIRSRYAEGGVTLRELALVYGVHKATIGAIVTRRNWRHIT